MLLSFRLSQDLNYLHRIRFLVKWTLSVEDVWLVPGVWNERGKHWKGRAACTQSFTQWQQAIIGITRRDHSCRRHQVVQSTLHQVHNRGHSPRSIYRDHSIVACSRYKYMSVILCAHPVRGELHFHGNVNREVARARSCRIRGRKRTSFLSFTRGQHGTHTGWCTTGSLLFYGFTHKHLTDTKRHTAQYRAGDSLSTITVYTTTLFGDALLRFHFCSKPSTSASMSCPFSSFFSQAMRNSTPSTTICTSSTSEKPSRSAFEMSNTPPSDAVSTPPARRSRKCELKLCFRQRWKSDVDTSGANVTLTPAVQKWRWHQRCKRDVDTSEKVSPSCEKICNNRCCARKTVLIDFCGRFPSIMHQQVLPRACVKEQHISQSPFIKQRLT